MFPDENFIYSLPNKAVYLFGLLFCQCDTVAMAVNPNMPMANAMVKE